MSSENIITLPSFLVQAAQSTGLQGVVEHFSGNPIEVWIYASLAVLAFVTFSRRIPSLYWSIGAGLLGVLMFAGLSVVAWILLVLRFPNFLLAVLCFVSVAAAFIQLRYVSRMQALLDEASEDAEQTEA